ncbi:hypothetical protein ILUMI_08142 [Ignelater luminosus]|uniref:PiggyBac transposable element-derived protein domain-containing protein n=1 Tax=Ignelater luminosus TaxID=2038154 RepID=A0A8K0GHB8_IGNLU|nr:hypothetical protein ILUMI_08142 [Ignelater luminosus]
MSCQGFKLFFDNYFSSIHLFLYLTEQGYPATGTIQSGRSKKCPLKSRVDIKKQLRGGYDYRTDSDNKVSLVRWKDNKVAYYNKNMGGVDKMDQLIAAYRTRIRQEKWW